GISACTVLRRGSGSAESYPLSLHDALPIYGGVVCDGTDVVGRVPGVRVELGCRSGEFQEGLEVDVFGDPFGQRLQHRGGLGAFGDRKSTRLNSSHVKITYAVFCFRKKDERA